MSRQISDRQALAPIAFLIAIWMLAGAVCALKWAELDLVAFVVGALSLPVAVAGLASIWQVFFRLLEAMAEIRRQRAKAEADAAAESGVPVDERDAS